MAEYKLVNTEKLESDLTNIADKIRILNGTTEAMSLDEMAVALDGIEIGVELPELSNPASAEEVFLNKEFIDEDGAKITGAFTIDDELTTQDNLITQIVSTLQNKASATPTLQTKTVTPTTAIQNVTPDSGYDGLSKVTVNAMPTATQATPTVSIDSAGKITASATQTAGYVSAGTKTGTKQLTTQAAKTITPSTSSQTAVASGRYTTGAVTVAGDANLKAENIAEGVSIFGVTGTHSGGSGGGGSVETITITYSSLPEPGTEIYYIDGTMTMQHTTVSRKASYTMIKGTIFVVTNYGGSDFCGCASICGNGMCKAFYAQSTSGGMSGGSDN